MLADAPFYGSSALNLRLAEWTATAPTQAGMSTDGTSLFYDPALCEGMPDLVAATMIAHEVSHCVLLHMYRIGDRELPLFNQAADYVVNWQLSQQRTVRKDGTSFPTWQLWPGALLDKEYADMDVEQVYARLYRAREEKRRDGQQPDENGDGGTPQPDFTLPEPGENGEPTDEKAQGGVPSDRNTEQDWQIFTEQAAMISRKAGAMPGDADRAIKDARASKTDWRSTLARFLENVVPSDVSWSTPNRRFIADGVYLPGAVRENMPRIAVAVDTSGSITESMLACFAGEMSMIFKSTRPEFLTVVYHDVNVAHVDTFDQSDDDVEFTPRGGGGTAFQPTLDYLSELDQPPACLIWLTDTYCGDSPTEPDFPVLFAVPAEFNAEGPFGETVSIDMHS